MAYDYSDLKGRIIAKMETRKAFAAAMGWSENTNKKKLDSLVAWKVPEIDRACELLEISREEIPKYFFKLEVKES